MKYLIIACVAIALFNSCALNDADVEADVLDFPFRLQMDAEGADLADAEDYSVEVSFADYLGELPASAITLEYVITGEGDFTGVTVDEVVYQYEDDDCVFVREITFTESSITIPVDPDLGTVPEEFEIVLAFNTSGDATDGAFEFELIGITTAANVVLNDVTLFEYEILENDVAGKWLYEITTAEQFESFKEALGTLSADLQEMSFEDITGEVAFEFEFEEMKIEIEMAETEIVEECEDGVTESEEENLVIEIEADYDAEDGELELEGDYFTEDDEELGYLIALDYELISADEITLTLKSIIGEDNYEAGDELYTGNLELHLIKD